MVKSLVQTRSGLATKLKSNVNKKVIKVKPLKVLKPQVDQLLLKTDILLFLIKTLQINPKVRNIKDVEQLITVLEELHSLIGMKSVKDSIAKQVMCLVESGTGVGNSSDMLHTVIYGPPGTGKTTVGGILCKIYIALGILTIPVVKQVKQIKKVVPRTIRLFRLDDFDLNSSESGSDEEEDGSFSDDESDSEEEEPDEDSVPEQPPSLFKVVSRPDFVAEYLGQTCTKTKKLLNDSVGKVLFIDEAYSLVTAENDSYGSEALSVLNQFMSERPKDIIVIFAGYKDNLKNTIFRDQPGLERRCSWYHEIQDYSPIELQKIFEYQCSKSKFLVDQSEQGKQGLLNFFIKNHKELRNFGGDTLKILFYAKLERSLEYFGASLSPKYKQDNILHLKHIESAFTTLYKNKLSDKSMSDAVAMMYC